jgi:hypothetical protein
MHRIRTKIEGCRVAIAAALEDVEHDYDDKRKFEAVEDTFEAISETFEDVVEERDETWALGDAVREHELRSLVEYVVEVVGTLEDEGLAEVEDFDARARSRALLRVLP